MRRNPALKKAGEWLTDLMHSWLSTPPRLLRVCETLPLGERRTMSIVQVGQERFLLGVTSGSMAMLAVLPGSGPRGADPGNRGMAADNIPDDEVPTWAWRDGSLNREFEPASVSPRKRQG
ncbi:MAG: flagellar biosynthetic protein FliO [Acidobacteriia bacterium]|nr:flagellar biosynthetic protein FliO [Terriglobia bacterium]